MLLSSERRRNETWGDRISTAIFQKGATPPQVLSSSVFQFCSSSFLHKICGEGGGEGGIVSGGERATSLSGIEFETFVKVVSRSAEAAAAAAAFPPSV